METGLRDRVALITGAASGIGKAIAQALASEGARVIVADLNEQAGRAAAAQIAGRSPARFVGCDVTDEASVEAAVSSALATEGRLDIMVNNAGIITAPASLLDSQAADWDRHFVVNLRGVFFGVKHAARAMLQSGGSIVNIASVAGMGGAPKLGPYGATKAAVIQLTQTAALEFARNRIRVNALCPGWTDTPLLDGFERSKLERQIPLGRLGQADEIASLVVYLASDAAAFITGSALRIDGGIRS
ncbi:MAG TPA: SDR family oxidoreductase [Roseiflexaceae bacterium]|nr:SDR family oxidoreductase [Roseiflexaceae bacterium]